MQLMRAIIIKQPGGPEQLEIKDRPAPEPKPGHVIIEVKAFGLNRAEIYMRSGAWGPVAEVSGIECVGIVRSDPDGRFAKGQKVTALMGGMGRTINGSYAELVSVPAGNVAALATNLSWEDLAAIPESYATAWSCLHGNLAIAPGQTLVVRGATSSLGQAALNIAADAGVHVIATTRNASRRPSLEELGAREVFLERADLSAEIRRHHADGVDAVGCHQRKVPPNQFRGGEFVSLRVWPESAVSDSADIEFLLPHEQELASNAGPKRREVMDLNGCQDSGGCGPRAGFSCGCRERGFQQSGRVHSPCV